MSIVTFSKSCDVDVLSVIRESSCPGLEDYYQDKLDDSDREEEANVRGYMDISTKSIVDNCSKSELLEEMLTSEIQNELQYRDNVERAGKFIILPDDSVSIYDLSLMKKVATLIHKGQLTDIKQIKL